MSARTDHLLAIVATISWLSGCSGPALATPTPVATPLQAPPAGTPTPPQSLTPRIQVTNQSALDGTVTITYVDALEQGWLAINADKEGAPGIVIGYSPVAPGVNMNVVVTLDLLHATPRLWAILHVDRGQVGTWEFPGPDVPVQVDGKTVMSSFNVTLPARVTPAP